DIEVGDATIGVTLDQGHYDASGFTAKGLKVTLDDRVELGGKDYKVALTGGTVELDIDADRVTRFASKGLKVELAGPHGIVLTGQYADARFEDGKLSGTGGLKLKDAVTIRDEGKRGVRIEKDASMDVTLVENKVTQVGTDRIAVVVLDESGEDLLSVTLTEGGLDLSKKTPSVSGKFEAASLAGEKSYDFLDGWLTVTLSKGASVSAEVVDNDLVAFDVQGVHLKLNPKKPDIEGVGMLPKFTFDGRKTGLEQFGFDGGILSGLRLGKYFDGGIMRDLKLLGGKFSMTGLGDIQLPFGIKARVGLDLGYDGDWLPEFSLENVSARLKLFDGIEDLISIGTKEKPKELLKTKPKKVSLVLPRIGSIDLDLTMGVTVYAKAG